MRFILLALALSGCSSTSAKAIASAHTVGTLAAEILHEECTERYADKTMTEARDQLCVKAAASFRAYRLAYAAAVAADEADDEIGAINAAIHLKAAADGVRDAVEVLKK